MRIISSPHKVQANQNNYCLPSPQTAHRNSAKIYFITQCNTLSKEYHDGSELVVQATEDWFLVLLLKALQLWKGQKSVARGLGSNLISDAIPCISYWIFRTPWLISTYFFSQEAVLVCTGDRNGFLLSQKKTAFSLQSAQNCVLVSKVPGLHLGSNQNSNQSCV